METVVSRLEATGAGGAAGSPVQTEPTQGFADTWRIMSLGARLRSGS